MRQKLINMGAAALLIVVLHGCQVPEDGPPPVSRIGAIEGEGEVQVQIVGLIATLTAVPDDGWEFDRWEGPNDLSRENPHNVGAAQLEDYTAFFRMLEDDGDDDDMDTNGPGDDDDVDTNGMDDDDSDDDVSDDDDPDDDDDTDDEPVLASFEVTGRDTEPRFFHAASRLNNGTVMISGGLGAEISPPSLVSLASVSFYDPATGEVSSQFTPLDGSGEAQTVTLNTPRSSHTQTTLLDGRVLITGGNANASGMDPGSAISDVEIFDPQTASMTEGLAMSQTRQAHSATLLPDGRVLVAGRSGRQFFMPEDDSWSATIGLSRNRTAHAAVLLEDFAGVEGDHRVLLIGGAGTGPETMELVPMDLSASTLLTSTLTIGVDDLAAERMPDGRVLIVGGQNATTGDTINATYVLDPVADTIMSIDPVPDRPEGIADHKIVPIDPYIVVFGGEQQVDGVDEELDYYAIFDTRDLTWVENGSMTFVHDDFPAVLLEDDSVLLIGGGIPILNVVGPSDTLEIFRIATDDGGVP